MTDLIALAERVEALTGPCRETDKAVARAIEFFKGSRASYDLQLNLIPKYTASLDAAMSLVRPGLHSIEVYSPEASDDVWTVHLFFTGESHEHSGVGATYANALTAAALRALSAMEQQP